MEAAEREQEEDTWHMNPDDPDPAYFFRDVFQILNLIGDRYRTCIPCWPSPFTPSCCGVRDCLV